MTKTLNMSTPDLNNFASRAVLRMSATEGRRRLKEARQRGSTARQGRTVGVLHDSSITIFEGIKAHEINAFMAWAVDLWSGRFEADADSIKGDYYWDGLMVRLDNTY